MRSTIVWLVLVASCGTDSAAPTANPDAGTPADGFQRLIASAWTLPAGTQKYLCVRQTVTSDIWVTSIRPVAPGGTHHTVLMVGPRDLDDGAVECDSALTKPAIYASGVGTQLLDMPNGVAIHVKPGQQLLLNLHLFNSGDNVLTGTSGIEYKPIDPMFVMHEAGVVLAGKTNFVVPDGGVTNQVGICTTPANVTVFAVAPHMHLLGTWMKVSYADANGGNPRVLHDASYNFDDQKFDVLSPQLVTRAGGKLTVECTYENHTGKPAMFGEHTEDEMCYSLSLLYPPSPVDSCTH